MNKKEKEKEKEIKKDIDAITNQMGDLQKIVDEMIGHAAEVVKEYDLDLSPVSGSVSDLSSLVTQISEDSPYMNEVFKGDAWKKVLQATVPNIDLTDMEENKKEDKKDDSK
tara:strand:- start:15 stop:347 length:333 start_codon:yes stop_codon:yes gene_type:complete